MFSHLSIHAILTLLSRIDKYPYLSIVDINVHCDPIFYKISKKKEKGRLESILMSRFDMQFLTIGSLLQGSTNTSIIEGKTKKKQQKTLSLVYIHCLPLL